MRMPSRSSIRTTALPIDEGDTPRCRLAIVLEVAGLGVRVNAVAPGPIETGMLNRFTGNAERKAGLVSSVPLGRVGKPDEIANALVFCDSAWKIDPCRGVIGVQL